jgi:hypothetical protein
VSAAQPIALVVKKVTLPTFDESKRSKSAENFSGKQQSATASNQLPEVVTTQKKNPVAMVVRPSIFMLCSPVVPDPFKHCRSHPAQQQIERFASIKAKLQDTTQPGLIFCI